MLAGGGEPAVVLELHLRRAGAAGFANLLRYTVHFLNMGGPPLAFERQHEDWLQDGGIELAGEALPGGRLLGRLRRSGEHSADGAARSYRWDLSFDASLSGRAGGHEPA